MDKRGRRVPGDSSPPRPSAGEGFVCEPAPSRTGLIGVGSTQKPVRLHLVLRKEAAWGSSFEKPRQRGFEWAGDGKSGARSLFPFATPGLHLLSSLVPTRCSREGREQ